MLVKVSLPSAVKPCSLDVPTVNQFDTEGKHESFNSTSTIRKIWQQNHFVHYFKESPYELSTVFKTSYYKTANMVTCSRIVSKHSSLGAPGLDKQKSYLSQGSSSALSRGPQPWRCPGLIDWPRNPSITKPNPLASWRNLSFLLPFCIHLSIYIRALINNFFVLHLRPSLFGYSLNLNWIWPVQPLM